MNDSKMRLYGMADPANHDAPAINGLRGEAAGDVAGSGYQRTVTLDDQPSVAVEEVSGVASAEAVRAATSVPAPIAIVPVAPLVPPPAPLPAAVVTSPPPPPPPLSPWPWIVVSLVAGFMLGKRRARTPVTIVTAPPPAAEGVRRDLDQVLV